MKTNEPYVYSKKFPLEYCSRINVDELVTSYKRSLLESLQNSYVEIEGEKITFVTRKNNYGERLYFKCGLCGKGVRYLYRSSLNENVGCRECVGLEYKNRI